MINYLLPIVLGLLIPLPEMEVVEQTVPQGVSPRNDFAYLQIIFYLLCFVAVLFIASKVTRWLGGKMGGSSGRHMRLVETLYLGPNRTLHLIMVGKQLFLVAGADRNLTLLTELNDPEMLNKILTEAEQVAAASQGLGVNGKNFSDYLKRFLNSSHEPAEPNNSQDKVTTARRIEERLMKFRIHRGPKTDE